MTALQTENAPSIEVPHRMSADAVERFVAASTTDGNDRDHLRELVAEQAESEFLDRRSGAVDDQWIGRFGGFGVLGS